MNPKNRITKFEMTILLPIVTNELIQRAGVPIYANELIKILNNYIDTLEEKERKVTPDRLRTIINTIRRSEILPVMSGQQGYWIDNDKQNIMLMAESLDWRAHSILSASAGLKSYAKKLP